MCSQKALGHKYTHAYLGLPVAPLENALPKETTRPVVPKPRTQGRAPPPRPPRPRTRPLSTAVGGTIRGPPLVYLSPTPPTYENEGSRGMVMPSHQKVRAAHGIDAWPSHVRQHVGSNRNNTSGSAQCLRRDSVNQSNGARAGCTWSHAQHLRRLCRGIQKRLFSRCSLALTATPPELLIMLAVFASIPVPQRFFCSALKIDGPTRHGPRR